MLLCEQVNTRTSMITGSSNSGNLQLVTLVDATAAYMVLLRLLVVLGALHAA